MKRLPSVLRSGLIFLCCVGCAQSPPREGASFHGDTSVVTSLALDEGGTVWAATKGGLLRIGAASENFGWGGLIEGRGPDDVWIEGRQVFAGAGDTVAVWDAERLVPSNFGARRKEPVVLSEAGWQVPARPIWVDVADAPPGGIGTHVTAVVGDPQRVITAWYGDGLWERVWRPGPDSIPGPQDRGAFQPGHDLIPGLQDRGASQPGHDSIPGLQDRGASQPGHDDLPGLQDRGASQPGHDSIPGLQDPGHGARGRAPRKRTGTSALRTHWRRVEAPGELRHVRAMALRDDTLAAATFSGDVWLRRQGRWSRVHAASGLKGSVYSLLRFGGKTFAGTFEDGLATYDGKRWEQLGPPTLSSTHPREMVVLGGALYARNTTGEVDRFDGKSWVKNVFPWLLRGPCTTLSVAEGRLLVGQFGGWSEFDGVRWEHFLKIPELQGVVVTALAARGDEVWVGTQGRGLVRFARARQEVSVYDQRHGLGDDWVRRILADDRGVVVGMFLKGAFRKEGERFDSLTPQVAGEATGLARDKSGRLLVGSRQGLWRIEKGVAVRVEVEGVTNLEVQALHSDKDGGWFGLPNGIVKMAP